MKRIISILLVFLLFIPSVAFARADKYVLYTDESSLYAVVNEELFIEFFGVSPAGVSAYHEIKSDSDLDSRFIEYLYERESLDDIADIKYTFDVDGKGALPSVTMQYMMIRTLNFSSKKDVIYTGATEKTATVNGRELEFYILINYSPNKRAMSVNIGVCDPDDPDNFTHFTIGEPFLSQDMMNAWTEYDHKNERGLYYPEYDPTYVFLEEAEADFNNEALRNKQSQALETSYNASNNMLKTEITTNARAIDEHFSKTGISHTTVAEISVTVQADENLFPRIHGANRYYEEVGGKEVDIGESNFRWYYILPMFYGDLFDYLLENAMHRHIPEYDDLDRTDTLILKKSHSVDFDNEPYLFEYRLDSPFLTAGRFKVSSHVLYRTLYTPAGTDMVVSYITDGGTAETDWVELLVR